MKKFLSLVLALVMTMSLVTISAGAKDFTDADKVTYTEAVDVLSAVKVIDGYTDGAFKPTTQLNRGQAAKILCNMILGPTTASALKADAAPFKDVAADSTFAGYIAYCAKEGIIDGYTDGTFRPAAPLTGYAFMKLLLGALGYDKDVEGYNVPNWSINVAKQALGIGLDDGLVEEFDGTKIVTREEACLYALNALQADMVEYDAKTTVNIGDASVTIAGSKAKAVEDKDNKNGTIKWDEKLQFAEKYFDDLSLNALDADDFGRPCRTWTLKHKDIGTYSKTGDLVATFTKKVKKTDVYKAIGKSVADDLYKGYAALYDFVDGAPAAKVADEDGYVTNVKDIVVEKNNSDKINGSGNGMLTEIYYDDDANKVTIVSINTYVFQASTDYNKTKESVEVVTAGDTQITLDDRTLSQEDFDVENVKADDYILITAVKDGNKYTAKTATVAEVVTGTVSGYKIEDSVTIDGTEYSYSLNTTKTSDGVSNDPVKSTAYTVGQDAAVVLDAYGYIIAIDKAVVSDNYVYVSEFAQPSGLKSGKVVASAYFTDGTTADITVKDLLGSSNKENMIPNGNKTVNAGWYTYSKNSDGQYSLYAVEKKYADKDALSDTKNYTAADVDIMFNNKVSFLKGAGVSADDKTIVIVDDENGDVSVYTGVKNIPDISLKAASTTKKAGTAKVTYLAKANGYAGYVFIDVDGNASVAGGEDTALVYFVKYDGKFKTTDNDVYYTYKVLKDAKEEVVKADSILSSIGDGNYYGAAYKTRTNTDGELTSADTALTGKFKSGKGAVITYSNGTLNIGGAGYTLADNYQITLVTLGELKDANKKVIADARALNKDKDADYEASIVTAKELADLVKGYTVAYNYQMKTTEVNGTVIEDLYVTVTSATEPVDQYTVTIKATGEADKTEKVNDGAKTFTYTVPAGKKLTAVKNGTASAETGEVTITLNSAITSDTTVEITLEVIPVPAETVLLTLKGDLATAKVYYTNGSAAKGTTETVEEFGVLTATKWTIEVPAAPVATFALRPGTTVDVAIVVNGIKAEVTLSKDETTFDSMAALIAETIDPAKNVVIAKNDTALTVKYSNAEGVKKPETDAAVAAIVKDLGAENIDKISVDKNDKYSFVCGETTYTFDSKTAVTAVEMVTISVDGKVIKTVVKDSAVSERIEGLAKGKYLFDKKASDTVYNETEPVTQNDNRNLYTAFVVTVPANTVAVAKVVDGDTTTTVTDSVKYVAKDAELIVTVRANKTVKIGDQVVTAGAEDKVVKVTVTAALTIAEYQTPEQFKADVASKTAGVTSKTTGEYTLTVDGKSATLVIASGKNITNVHDTGIGTAAKDLLNAGYTIKAGKYTFTKDNSISDGNLKEAALTAMASLIPTVDPLVDTEDKTETLTITVSNATGASEEFTVKVIQKV